MDYSRKDFTGQSLVDASDLNGQTIIGSNFSQAYPDTQVFPSDMIGAMFIDCNLDNCIIPSGNNVRGGSRNRIMIVDEQRWIVDKDNVLIQLLG